MSERTDETVNQIDEYIEKCRAMHLSHVGPVPRFAHAVSALADQRNALLDRVASLEQAIWEACDAFRSLGCSADADALEEAMDTSKGRAQSAREPRYQDRPTAADSAVGTAETVLSVIGTPDSASGVLYVAPPHPPIQFSEKCDPNEWTTDQPTVETARYAAHVEMEKESRK